MDIGEFVVPVPYVKQVKVSQLDLTHRTVFGLC